MTLRLAPLAKETFVAGRMILAGTESGAKILSGALPTEPEEIERAIAK